jgi:hypothetical protein
VARRRRLRFPFWLFIADLACQFDTECDIVS